MKTNPNSTASLEPSTNAADFAERVRVNQGKLTSELRPHYDFHRLWALLACKFGDHRKTPFPGQSFDSTAARQRRSAAGKCS